MGKFFDIADQIKSVIDALPEMSGTESVVDRQKDLNAEFKKITAKLKGVAIISWLGGQNPDEDGNLQIDSQYGILLFCKPIIRPGQTPADEIIEAIAKALDGWNYSATQHCDYEARVTGITPVQNEQYLVSQISIQIRINL